jgi:hypothetical protein
MAKAKPQEPQWVDASEIRTGQPGVIGSGAATVGGQGTLYRAGMQMELQKLGSSKREEQLSLWEQAEDVQVTGTEVSGLNLTVSEDKALSALQILLDRTDYKGNRPGEELHTETYQGTLPRLAVSYSDFFDAYGLKPGRTGHHKQEQEALEALRSLAETKRRVYYTRHSYRGTGKNRRKVSDVVVWTAPVISLETVDVYRDLTDDEAARVQAGEDRPGRKSGFVVTFSSLFSDQIETFYLLKRTDLHEQIKQLQPRASRAVSLFVEWLPTLDQSPFCINKETLIEKLWLHDLYHRQRRKSYVEKQLQQAIETALTLGYLTDWHQDATGMFTFHLNPERCKRVEAKRRRALPQPE